MRTGIHARKYEFFAAWKVQQRQVFGGRSHKNQVVRIGVIQRKQTPALDPNRMIQAIKYLVKLMDGQNFTDSGVVVQNQGLRIAPPIKVAHPSFGTSDKCCITEN